MKRTAWLLALLLTACGSWGAHPAAPAPVKGAAAALPDYQHWQPPAPGTAVSWDSLPSQAQRQIRQNGLASPDGRWLAAKVDTPGGDVMLWLAASNGSTARPLEAHMAGYGLGVWSPQGTFLYRRPVEDDWREAEPAGGMVRPFLAALLTGRSADLAGFSPDGRRLLFNSPICYCNRPSPRPVTTYVVGTDGTGLEAVGIDVAAHWEGERLVTSLLAPSVLRLWDTPPSSADGVRRLPAPSRLIAWVRAATAVRWRAYPAQFGAGGGEPLAVINGRETEPGVWEADRPDPPPLAVRLVLSAAARPGVAPGHGLQPEGDRLWVSADAGLVQGPDQPVKR